MFIKSRKKSKTEPVVKEKKKTNIKTIFEDVYCDDGKISQEKMSAIIDEFVQEKIGNEHWNSPIQKKVAWAFLMSAVNYCLEFLPERKKDIFTLLRLTKIAVKVYGEEYDYSYIMKKVREERPYALCLNFYDIFEMMPKSEVKETLCSLAVELVHMISDREYVIEIEKCKREDLLTDKPFGYYKDKKIKGNKKETLPCYRSIEKSVESAICLDAPKLKRHDENIKRTLDDTKEFSIPELPL